MTVSNQGYTEVNVWLPKDVGGNYSTSAWGAKKEGRGKARSGHSSMTVFPKDGGDPIHMSLWPKGGSKKSRPGVLIEHLADDEKGEGSKATAIITLYKLNIQAMLKAFNQVKARINQLRWSYVPKSSHAVTCGKCKEASCATFVLSILQKGGFSQRYKSSLSGPKDRSFYNLTHCNEGEILRGFFNGAKWRNLAVSPKTILHLVASAAETVNEDKVATIGNMSSQDVENPIPIGEEEPTTVPESEEGCIVL